MDTRSYNTSRLFANNFRSSLSCGYCPECDCGEYNVDDTWYVEYQDYDDIKSNQASCTKCTCKMDSYYGNPLKNYTYADCEYGDSYDIGSDTCDSINGLASISSTNYYCHRDYPSASNGILIFSLIFLFFSTLCFII